MDQFFPYKMLKWTLKSSEPNTDVRFQVRRAEVKFNLKDSNKCRQDSQVKIAQVRPTSRILEKRFAENGGERGDYKITSGKENESIFKRWMMSASHQETEEEKKRKRNHKNIRCNAFDPLRLFSGEVTDSDTGSVYMRLDKTPAALQPKDLPPHPTTGPSDPRRKPFVDLSNGDYSDLRKHLQHMSTTQLYRYPHSHYHLHHHHHHFHPSCEYEPEVQKVYGIPVPVGRRLPRPDPLGANASFILDERRHRSASSSRNRSRSSSATRAQHLHASSQHHHTPNTSTTNNTSNISITSCGSRGVAEGESQTQILNGSLQFKRHSIAGFPVEANRSVMESRRSRRDSESKGKHKRDVSLDGSRESASGRSSSKSSFHFRSRSSDGSSGSQKGKQKTCWRSNSLERKILKDKTKGKESSKKRSISEEKKKTKEPEPLYERVEICRNSKEGLSKSSSNSSIGSKKSQTSFDNAIYMSMRDLRAQEHIRAYEDDGNEDGDDNEEHIYSSVEVRISPDPNQTPVHLKDHLYENTLYLPMTDVKNSVRKASNNRSFSLSEPPPRFNLSSCDKEETEQEDNCQTFTSEPQKDVHKPVAIKISNDLIARFGKSPNDRQHPMPQYGLYIAAQPSKLPCRQDGSTDENVHGVGGGGTGGGGEGSKGQVHKITGQHVHIDYSNDPVIPLHNLRPPPPPPPRVGKIYSHLPSFYSSSPSSITMSTSKSKIKTKNQSRVRPECHLPVIYENTRQEAELQLVKKRKLRHKMEIEFSIDDGDVAQNRSSDDVPGSSPRGLNTSGSDNPDSGVSEGVISPLISPQEGRSSPLSPRSDSLLGEPGTPLSLDDLTQIKENGNDFTLKENGCSTNYTLISNLTHDITDPRFLDPAGCLLNVRGKQPISNDSAITEASIDDLFHRVKTPFLTQTPSSISCSNFESLNSSPDKFESSQSIRNRDISKLLFSAVGRNLFDMSHSTPNHNDSNHTTPNSVARRHSFASVADISRKLSVMDFGDDAAGIWDTETLDLSDSLLMKKSKSLHSLSPGDANPQHPRHITAVPLTEAMAEILLDPESRYERRRNSRREGQKMSHQCNGQREGGGGREKEEEEGGEERGEGGVIGSEKVASTVEHGVGDRTKGSGRSGTAAPDPTDCLAPSSSPPIPSPASSSCSSTTTTSSSSSTSSSHPSPPSSYTPRVITCLPQGEEEAVGEGRSEPRRPTSPSVTHQPSHRHHYPHHHHHRRQHHLQHRHHQHQQRRQQQQRCSSPVGELGSPSGSPAHNTGATFSPSCNPTPTIPSPLPVDMSGSLMAPMNGGSSSTSSSSSFRGSLPSVLHLAPEGQDSLKSESQERSLGHFGSNVSDCVSGCEVNVSLFSDSGSSDGLTKRQIQRREEASFRLLRMIQECPTKEEEEEEEEKAKNGKEKEEEEERDCESADWSMEAVLDEVSILDLQDVEASPGRTSSGSPDSVSICTIDSDVTDNFYISPRLREKIRSISEEKMFAKLRKSFRRKKDGAPKVGIVMFVDNPMYLSPEVKKEAKIVTSLANKESSVWYVGNPMYLSPEPNKLKSMHELNHSNKCEKENVKNYNLTKVNNHVVNRKPLNNIWLQSNPCYDSPDFKKTSNTRNIIEVHQHKEDEKEEEADDHYLTPIHVKYPRNPAPRPSALPSRPGAPSGTIKKEEINPEFLHHEYCTIPGDDSDSWVSQSSSRKTDEKDESPAGAKRSLHFGNKPHSASSDVMLDLNLTKVRSPVTPSRIWRHTGKNQHSTPRQYKGTLEKNHEAVALGNRGHRTPRAVKRGKMGRDLKPPVDPPPPPPLPERYYKHPVASTSSSSSLATTSSSNLLLENTNLFHHKYEQDGDFDLTSYQLPPDGMYESITFLKSRNSSSSGVSSEVSSSSNLRGGPESSSMTHLSRRRCRTPSRTKSEGSSSATLRTPGGSKNGLSSFPGSHQSRPSGVKVRTPRMTSKKYRARDVLQGKGQLKLAVYENFGLLTIHVEEAKRLKSRFSSICNPYVKISLIPDTEERTFCRTPLERATSSPYFKQKFSFDFLPEDFDKRLLISVWSRDTLRKRSEFLGCMSFSVAHITTKRVQGWFRLLTEAAGRRKHFAVSFFNASSSHEHTRRDKMEEIIILDENRGTSTVTSARGSIYSSTDNINSINNNNNNNNNNNYHANRSTRAGLVEDVFAPGNAEDEVWIHARPVTEVYAVPTRSDSRDYEEIDEYDDQNEAEASATPPDSDTKVSPQPGRSGQTPYTISISVSKTSQGFGFSVAWTKPPRVENVAPGLPADLAGLRTGDYLIFVGDHNVVKMEEDSVLNVIRECGEILPLEVYRRGVNKAPRDLANGRLRDGLHNENQMDSLALRDEYARKKLSHITFNSEVGFGVNV